MVQYLFFVRRIQALLVLPRSTPWYYYYYPHTKTEHTYILPAKRGVVVCILRENKIQIDTGN